jgi:hypothetical protein
MVSGASPRSASVIGLIRRRMIRPAPESVGAFVGDLARNLEAALGYRFVHSNATVLRLDFGHQAN